ncbi:SigE family RNA polymerase sigma factor [Kitasatospora sp. NBC_00240]|uniref:sigma factor-like helix-turn-helix DNA-binding protein n=1 Tax=Kitasatospora sp. NBC_00240 TaxID=2903567 RepID=UPI002256721D|nr:sigma factor-like helix-turn-helix DNA-binding protein [Kitasatospora sp. NBC_00240]MCX5207866.1 SigE family RNA polymerase sigma factor [Kitasatospora sp. NBC_00240]
MISDGAAKEFHDYFERHHAELARLAHLLTGGTHADDAPDDLAADALAAVRRDWERTHRADRPTTHAHRAVISLARERARRAARTRRLAALLRPYRPGPTARARPTEVAAHPDRAGAKATPDVREALARLPFRSRVCVVLRYAFDLSERDVARTLRLPVGAVRRRTSKGSAQLRRLLGAPTVDHPRDVRPAPAVRPPPVRTGRTGRTGDPGPARTG